MDGLAAQGVRCCREGVATCLTPTRGVAWPGLRVTPMRMCFVQSFFSMEGKGGSEKGVRLIDGPRPCTEDAQEKHLASLH